MARRSYTTRSPCSATSAHHTLSHVPTSSGCPQPDALLIAAPTCDMAGTLPSTVHTSLVLWPQPMMMREEGERASSCSRQGKGGARVAAPESDVQ